MFEGKCLHLYESTYLNSNKTKKETWILGLLPPRLLKKYARIPWRSSSTHFFFVIKKIQLKDLGKLLSDDSSSLVYRNIYGF